MVEGQSLQEKSLATLKKICIFIPGLLLGVAIHGWTALALYYCGFPSAAGLRALIAIIYLLSVILFIILNRQHIRAFFISLLAFVIVALWFSSIQPQAGGVYPPELTLPRVDFNGDQVTIHNVRNCVYRTATDFDVRYENRTYYLKDLRTLDVLVNYWGMEAIAHTFLSFGFSDGQYLAVSVEIRPKVGKAYDMLQGFFKQYQLIYIWADERDLIRLRTNFKKENVYLYRTTMPPEAVRKMFLSMLHSTEDIAHKPQFYDTLTHSCTNTLGNHLIAAKIAEIPFWKRRILTGTVDFRLYKGGAFGTSVSFPELRRQAHIDSRAQAADQDPDFSNKIRTHLH